MDKEYKKHSSVIFDNRAVASREKEFAVMASAFSERRIIEIPLREGTRVPEGAEFLCERHAEGVPMAFFVHDVPVPRPIPVLNLAVEVAILREITIKNIFDTYPDIRQPKYQELLDLHIADVIRKVFVSSEERRWWESCVELDINHNVMKSAYQLRIRLVDKP